MTLHDIETGVKQYRAAKIEDFDLTKRELVVKAAPYGVRSDIGLDPAQVGEDTGQKMLLHLAGERDDTSASAASMREAQDRIMRAIGLPPTEQEQAS